MKLTRVERWILSNQFQILEKLSRTSEEAIDYVNARTVLERGYELEYPELLQHVYDDEDCVSSDDCREVINILTMYDDLRRSYENLSDKTGIEPGDVAFPGFSGNDETTQLAYCRHFCDTKGRFAGIERGDDFNGHFPMLDKYRRMLGLWEAMPKRDTYGRKSREQVLDLLNGRREFGASARPTPQSS